MLQLTFLNGLEMHNQDWKATILKYMEETLKLRKAKLFDKIEGWRISTILKEFKQFLNYYGEIVSTIFI